MFSALLDANVLWPNMRRNFLLALAAERAYRPLWSDALLEEIEYHEIEKLIYKGKSKAEATARAARLVHEMRTGLPDALVAGWEPLEGSYGLPDPNDEHVLAAAVVGGAGAIVTLNMKHFPRKLVPDTVELVTPQDFAFSTVSMHPSKGLKAAESIVHFSGTGGLAKRSLEEVFEQLRTVYGMDDTVDLLEYERA